MSMVEGAALDTWSKLVSRLGFPIAVCFILLFQLVPKIDEGIAIANRVDGQLRYMQQNCVVTPALR